VKKQRRHNTGLAKVAVQCSADTFVVNQSLVLRINICGENRHLRQARNRQWQTCDDRKSHIKPTEKRPEMPTAQNGTFGFARHTSRTFAKPKEPFFSNAQTSMLKII
jgi:hypothetical protein